MCGGIALQQWVHTTRCNTVKHAYCGLPGFRDYLGKSAWFQKLAYINMYKLPPDLQTPQHSVQWTGFPVPPVPKLEKKKFT